MVEVFWNLYAWFDRNVFGGACRFAIFEGANIFREKTFVENSNRQDFLNDIRFGANNKTQTHSFMRL